MSHKAKVIAIGIISILVLIVFLQNTQLVDTRILFFTISAPRVIMLAGTFLLGLLVGALMVLLARKSSSGKKE